MGHFIRIRSSSSRGCGLCVGCARISNMDDFVLNRMAANGSAGIYCVDVVDAAANCVLLDNSNAHFADVVGGVVLVFGRQCGNWVSYSRRDPCRWFDVPGMEELEELKARNGESERD